MNGLHFSRTLMSVARYGFLRIKLGVTGREERELELNYNNFEVLFENKITLFLLKFTFSAISELSRVGIFQISGINKKGLPKYPYNFK